MQWELWGALCFDDKSSPILAYIWCLRRGKCTTWRSPFRIHFLVAESETEFKIAVHSNALIMELGMPRVKSPTSLFLLLKGPVFKAVLQPLCTIIIWLSRISLLFVGLYIAYFPSHYEFKGIIQILPSYEGIIQILPSYEGIIQILPSPHTSLGHLNLDVRLRNFLLSPEIIH